MNFGVFGIYRPRTIVAGDSLTELIGEIEAAGFESVWVGEHVVLPAAPQTPYPYSSAGTIDPDTAMPDPLSWLAFVAGASRRLRLGTGVMVLGQRHPLIVAKEAATIDVLSGGRLILGIGVGWLREECEALGLPFSERGRRTDEYIQALRTIWAEDAADFDGHFVHFAGVKSYPKPAMPSGVPIVIGGGTEAAARRAGRLGDGFFPIGANASRLGTLIEEMRAAARGAERDPDAIEITYRAGRTLDSCERYAELGVSRLVLQIGGSDLNDYRRTVDRFAHDVLANWSGLDQTGLEVQG